jgi:polysaccharide biosynthesis protein PslG
VPKRIRRARAVALVACALVGAALVSSPAATGGGGRPGPGVSLKSAATSRVQARVQARVFRQLLGRLRRTNPRKVRPVPVRPASPGSNSAPALPLGSASRFGISPDNIEFEEPHVRDRLLDSMVAAGARWIRFDVKWEVIQYRGPGSYDFARYDELVGAARARGLQVLGTLAYAPRWARSASCADSFFCEPRDANEYASWAAETVAHFRGRISHWEIWNEPNIEIFWRPKPNAGRYTALLRPAYGRIKAADPSAVVLAGATSPAPNDGTRIDEVTFLQQVYAAGGAGYFDAWSHHPYTHPGPPGNVHPDSAWYQIYGARPNIRGVMAANGDGSKKVWGTEHGPPTAGAPGAVSEAIQAQHVTDAYRLWRSYDWAGPLFWYSGRDVAAPGESGEAWRYHGLLRRDFTRKPAWAAYRAAAAAASS